MIAPLDDESELSDSEVISLFEANKRLRQQEYRSYVRHCLRQLNEGAAAPIDGSLWKSAATSDSIPVWTKGVSAVVEPRQQAGMKLIEDVPHRVWRKNSKAIVPEKSPQTFQVDELILRAPRYELCAPASANHALDLSDGKAVEFQPHPDDQTFESVGYLESKTKKWETISRNNSDDAALIDTAETLISEYAMKDSDVKTRFKRLFDVAEYDRLMSTSRSYLTRMASSIATRDTEDVICNLPHCMHPDCIHIVFRRQFRRFKRSFPLRAYRPNPCTKACSRSCYLESKDISQEESDQWDEDQYEILKQIIETDPDVTSCELSEICGTTCLQAHLHRIGLSKDSSQVPGSPTKRTRSTRQTRLGLATVDDYKGLPVFVPCKHSGPCNPLTCTCCHYKKRCERYCPCAPDCPRKPEVCPPHCKCNTEACPCYAESRECDPDVCHGGLLRALKSADLCCNANLQMRRPARTVVTLGSFGWGLYADEDINKDGFVGEYVGEYERFTREDEESAVLAHLGRSYAFGATGKWSINSAVIGNDTRFMNHASDTQHPGSNVMAKNLIVNGDARMALFARRRIKKGEEMTLDYGPSFFISDSKSETAENEESDPN